MIIVKSIQSGKYRQSNNTWAPYVESARKFEPDSTSLTQYKNYPEYYELIEVDD